MSTISHDHIFVDPDEEGSFEKAIKENTKAIFIETLGNSNLNNVSSMKKISQVGIKSPLSY